jgi:hypothetical protein
MNDHLEERCAPHAISQVRSCDGSAHATHRELTGLVLYYCNCGYSSGWVDRSTLPLPADFIRDHLPPGTSVGWPKEPTA